MNRNDDRPPDLTQSSDDIVKIDRPRDSAKTPAEDKFLGASPKRNPWTFEHSRYRIHKKLGAGGFGHVYLADDKHMRRLVALKFVHNDSLLTEARASAKLKHPGIVALFDVDIEGRFIVQELVNGSHLSLWRDGRPLTFMEMAQLTIEIADAVGYAHRNDIVHCDLKPGNILVDGMGHPHITDFGLAIRTDKPMERNASAGTLAFMAPEQWQAKQLDSQTDIWALGVILYYLLTGQLPFSAPDVGSLSQQVESATPDPPSKRNPRVPDEFEQVCLKCLEKKPTDRYQTMDEVMHELQQALRRRAGSLEWRHTPSLEFGCNLSQFRTDEVVRLFESVTSVIDPEKPQANSHLAELAANCTDYLFDSNIELDAAAAQSFENFCIRAMNSEIGLRQRHACGRALGRLGRLAVTRDLRQQRDTEMFCAIDAGGYRIASDRQSLVHIYSFRMGRFPVTNAQFRFFVDDGGYDDERNWSSSGWFWRCENPLISEPLFWHRSRWNGPNQPVVGVSFWEVEAFANWAGFRLPSELEWEAAARGPQGRDYPFDARWEDGICNSHEAGLHVTSPVGMFPKSRSVEFGIEDLAGNVREWCDSPAELNYRNVTEGRSLRGGSWYHLGWVCRGDYRNDGQAPSARNSTIGFRVVVD